MSTQIEGQAETLRECIFQKQVCVPKSMTEQEIINFANTSPSGTTNGWTIEEGSEDSPKYVQCAKFESHWHVLFNA